MTASDDAPQPGAYRPYVSARRPGGRPERAPIWRVVVHRRFLRAWEELADRLSVDKAQLFWDHVACQPDRPPRIGRSSVMKGKHGGGGDGWSPIIHYEISGAGRIDYQYRADHRTAPDGDPHPVVRIRSVDLGSH